MKLDERQKNLLFAEVEKEMDAVELSKEELESIVGGSISLKPPTSPIIKPVPVDPIITPIEPCPPIMTTMALGEEDDSWPIVKLK